MPSAPEGPASESGRSLRAPAIVRRTYTGSTNGPGRAPFQMLGVFAELERAMLVERVQAGLRRASAQGKRLGRPRVSEKVEHAIRRELAKGRGIHTVAKAVGVGTGTVQRVRAELAKTA